MSRYAEFNNGLKLITDIGICINLKSGFIDLPARTIKAKLKKAHSFYHYLLDLEVIEFACSCGEPYRFIDMADDDENRNLLAALNRISENPFASKNEIAIAQKYLSAYNHLIERRAAKRSPNKTLRKQIIERDKSKCRYCGNKVDGIIHIDHVIPYSLGGRTEIENLVTACSGCNLRKSGKTLQEAGIVLLNC